MWFVHLPDVDLAYLPQGIKEFDEYVEAVEWAQRFAMVNREIMMENALNALRRFFPDLATTEEAVNCHHNYVEMENHYGANVWLTRKGAVRARSGDLGIIPGSMGAKSFIVRGKGNSRIGRINGILRWQHAPQYPPPAALPRLLRCTPCAAAASPERPGARRRRMR